MKPTRRKTYLEHSRMPGRQRRLWRNWTRVSFLVFLVVVGAKLAGEHAPGSRNRWTQLGDAGSNISVADASAPNSGQTARIAGPTAARSSGPTTAPTTGPAGAPTGAPTTGPASRLTGNVRCVARGLGEDALPDPSCTPGSTNPSVNQGNIGSTICARGWSRTIRPPLSYTEALKHSQMLQYGEGESLSMVEEDHLIPLELGGSPTDPSNLWPEPARSPNLKDQVENAANRAVCQGRLSLSDAQQAIATNWTLLGQRLGVPLA